jgi:hypothetical protein
MLTELGTGLTKFCTKLAEHLYQATYLSTMLIDLGYQRIKIRPAELMTRLTKLDTNRSAGWLNYSS